MIWKIKLIKVNVYFFFGWILVSCLEQEIALCMITAVLAAWVPSIMLSSDQLPNREPRNELKY